MAQTEAFARAIIDAQLVDQGWKLTDGISVRFESIIQSQTTTAPAAAEATFQSLLHRSLQSAPDMAGGPAAALTANT